MKKLCIWLVMMALLAAPALGGWGILKPHEGPLPPQVAEKRVCFTCGDGFFNLCDRDECSHLGQCDYDPRLIGGRCLPKGCASEGAMCGGIAGITCCSGIDCALDGTYPDASGTCVVKGLCRSDTDCPQGYKCYNPGECGLGPSGPVPCPLEDDQCHKLCETDGDCPAAAPHCLYAQWSDYQTYRLCFAGSPEPADEEITIPTQFDLIVGQSATATNYREMRITLDSIAAPIKSSSTAGKVGQSATVTVTTPGGCGPNSDPGCKGPPAYAMTFTLPVGEAKEVLGTMLTLHRVGESLALFSITFSQQPCAQEGAMCGGIAGITCCSGIDCALDGTYPDASGTCVVKGLCRSDTDCPQGYKCYNPGECGLGPSGPVPCPLEDGQCHKLCETDGDCPAAAPHCLDAQWSDDQTYRLCFAGSPEPADEEITIPTQFDLLVGQSATATNYQEMRITLDGIAAPILSSTAGKVGQSATVTVTTPGGCGPNSDPGCKGPPAYAMTFTLAAGESRDVLGVTLTLLRVGTEVATFSIGFREKQCASEGAMCGGIAGITCCSGLRCQLDGSYPDAGGKCVKDVTCRELQGYPCPTGTVCPMRTQTASDTESCCPEPCVKPQIQYCKECGSGLFNLCDRKECYSASMESCYYTDTLASGSCNTCNIPGGVRQCSMYGSDTQSCADDRCGVGPCSWDDFQQLCFAGSPEPADEEITIPTQFDLLVGQSATATNYREMRITLDGIAAPSTTSSAGMPAPAAAVTVTTPGGCGPDADPRCLGPPATSTSFTLSLGQTKEILGTSLTFTDVGSTASGFGAWFSIAFVQELTCGDGVIDAGEECDGANWGAVTGCADFGFTGGMLSCDRDCTFDTRNCTVQSCSSAGQTCGGIAGITCCSGLRCQLDGSYPDAGGKCVKDVTCRELQGYPCPTGTVCPMRTQTASDTESCCSEPCVKPQIQYCKECGSGLFNLCDREECYSASMESCYFTDTATTGSCAACSSTTVCSSYGKDFQSCGDDPCGVAPCSWDDFQQRCVQTITCKDSDNGKDYYARGYVISGNVASRDLCTGSGILLEQYCDSAGNPASEEYRCPVGCLDGACVR